MWPRINKISPVLQYFCYIVHFHCLLQEVLHTPLERKKSTHDAEELGSGSVTMLLGYIPLRTNEAPSFTINKNDKYPLAKLAIMKGVHVEKNILSNKKKMGFIDHDLWKFHELDMLWYMTYV